MVYYGSNKIKPWFDAQYEIVILALLTYLLNYWPWPWSWLLKMLASDLFLVWSWYGVTVWLAGREAALWEVEERHLLELGAETKQHIQQSHDLRRRQLAFRRAQVSLCCLGCQWLLSLYLVGAACAQWKIGGGSFDKVVDQNTLPPYFSLGKLHLNETFPFFIFPCFLNNQ